MKIQYTGRSTVREIGKYIWNEKNGFVQDVTEPELIENLLTYPDDSFVEAEEVEKQDDEKQKGDSLQKEK